VKCEALEGIAVRDGNGFKNPHLRFIGLGFLLFQAELDRNGFKIKLVGFESLNDLSSQGRSQTNTAGEGGIDNHLFVKVPRPGDSEVTFSVCKKKF